MSAHLRKKRAKRDDDFLRNNGPGVYILRDFLHAKHGWNWDEDYRFHMEKNPDVV